MQFDFNWYSTPLLFGFVQGWVYAIMFWVRGWRHERLSDRLFGFLLAALTFEIWEYMLGFAGIEILWRELEFFPRNFGFLVPPLAYFYLKSQLDADFRFSIKDLRHALPFLIYVIYHLAVFTAGPDFVQFWKQNYHFPLRLDWLDTILRFVSQGLYFFWAFQHFKRYRQWLPTQFSNTETISFAWFQNFLWAFFIANVLGWAMTAIDFWWQLDFWHDWWDELFGSFLIYYLAISGFAQVQPRKIGFASAENPEQSSASAAEAQPESSKEKSLRLSGADLENWRRKLEKVMSEDKIYLDPELNLADLAKRLGTNVSILSAVVNTGFGKNFNDYVNEFRIEAVKRMLSDASSSHLSLLGIGLECGFNSKSTFNRAFKKITGVVPGEWKGADAVV